MACYLALNDFRDRVGKCIEGLHAQLINIAIEQHQLDPSVGVQDGTSFAACASRHRMVNEQTLASRQRLLGELLDGSAVEDETLPKWVPTTPAGRLELARRMERAHVVLRERMEENAKKPRVKRKEPAKI